MADNDYWLDPPRNEHGGGFITWKKEDADVEDVNLPNQHYLAGWQCLQLGSPIFPWQSDMYEAYSYHTYVKFPITAISGASFKTASLNMKVGNGSFNGIVTPAYIDLDVYYKPYKPGPAPPPKGDEFPWDDYLDLWDYKYPPSPIWTKLASWEDMNSIIETFAASGAYWLTMDVTSGVQIAVDNGWDWVAFRVSPSYDAPIDWDYDDRPVPYDQYAWVTFFGAATVYRGNTPTGHPDAIDNDVPWLQVVYSGGASQPAPGEMPNVSGFEVLCIAADPRANMGIAGTTWTLSGESQGSLYHCWSGGGEWSKIYEADSPITAVYMDHVKNFLDYPNEEIAWFGTQSGGIYKSIDSLSTWGLVHEIGSSVVEIQGSHLDSNKVVVGGGDSIYVTKDGGDTWVTVYTYEE